MAKKRKKQAENHLIHTIIVTSAGNNKVVQFQIISKKNYFCAE